MSPFLPLLPSGPQSPTGSLASHMVPGAGPRRRVPAIGAQLCEHHSSSRSLGLPARATLTPRPPPLTVRAAHPLPFGSPLAAASLQMSPSAASLYSNASTIELSPIGDQLDLLPSPQHANQLFQTLYASPRTLLPNGSFFSPATLASLGSSAQPSESRHPMLSCLAQMDRQDAAGLDGQPDESEQHKVDLVERAVSQISVRFERRRWKESRCGKSWSTAPVPTPEFQPQLEKDPTVDLAAYMSATVKNRCKQELYPEWAHVEADFKRLVWLVDPASGSRISPEALTPLMFWLGFARNRRASIAVFEIAFGRGDIGVDKIVELAPYFNVQIQLAEGFKTLARKDSFEQLCAYVTDEQRIQGWWTAMNTDRSGRVELDKIETMLARMQVITMRNSRVLTRFLGHAAALYDHTLSDIHDATAAKHLVSSVTNGAGALSQRGHVCQKDKNTYSSHFLKALLCRSVVTCCIVKVLDLMDPWPRARAAGGYDASINTGREIYGTTLASASGRHIEEAKTGVVDFKVLQRWAQVHRRISVSLMVNHRYWGREGRAVLASLKQPPLAICEDFTAQQWKTLFQHAKAQGMASTFPVADEIEDPEFLMKKAQCAVEMDR